MESQEEIQEFLDFLSAPYREKDSKKRKILYKKQLEELAKMDLDYMHFFFMNSYLLFEIICTKYPEDKLLGTILNRTIEFLKENELYDSFLKYKFNTDTMIKNINKRRYS